MRILLILLPEEPVETSLIDLIDEDLFDFGKRSVPKDLFETNYFYLIDEDPSDFGKRSVPIFL